MRMPLHRRPTSLRAAALLLSIVATLTRVSPSQTAPPLPSVHESHPAAPIADILTLTVNGVSAQLTPAALAKMPQTSVTVHNSHTNADEQYTGVALSDLLAGAGLPLTPAADQALLHSYIRAQGTDFYFVLYSGTEVESALHKGKVLVALRLNGQPLTTDGRFRLISTEDLRPARWVRNLNSLTFITVN